MQFLRSAAGIIAITALSLQATAQDAPRMSQEQQKAKWLDDNMYTRQDAIDFIVLTYKTFTAIVSKKENTTGIYDRNIKFKNCELIIETSTSEQESSWKSDREFKKRLTIIELDQVKLDGNVLRPKSDSTGLYAGSSIARSKPIPSFPIYSPMTSTDDPRWTNLHYEEHLLWAYEFLVDQCSKK